MSQRRAVRVPERRQLTVEDCGAAALAMIVSHFGRDITVAACRKLLSPGRDGISAKRLVETARSFGLAAKGVRTDLEGLRSIQLPAILHWRMRHFVVLEKVTHDRFRIVDPAQGRMWIERDDFSESFTGIALVFEKGADFVERRRPFRQIGAWISYCTLLTDTSGLQWLAASVLGTSLLLLAAGTALPIVTKLIVDVALPTGSDDALRIVIYGALAISLGQGVLNYLRGEAQVTLAARIDSHLATRFVDHLLRLPYSFFQQRAGGDLIQRLASTRALRDLLTGQLPTLLLDTLLAVGYVGVMAWLSPHFATVVLLAGAAQAALVAGGMPRVYGLQRTELAAQAEENSYLVEVIRNVAQIKASGGVDRGYERWRALFKTVLAVSVDRNRIDLLIRSASNALGSMVPIVVLYLGARQVLSGELPLGTMLALTTLVGATLRPLSSLVLVGKQFYLASAHLERVVDVLDERPETRSTEPATARQFHGAIRCLDVWFRYTPDTDWVLREISLEISPGTKLALVGRTGAGKTTLALLLARLYLPTRGVFEYDGQPADSFSRDELRARIGVVLQDAGLVGGSIRQNIAAGQPDVPLDAIVLAAQRAQVHDDIMSMPLAYETQVGEGGSAVSGGQKQRIAIARALLNEPHLVLLDEATSHIDTRTERRIVREIDALKCTQVVIAHRLSTVTNADQIAVLDRGTIVALGTHSELMRTSVQYSGLVGTIGESR